MSGHAHIIVVTVEDESHSSDKDDSTGLEKTTATEMCTACGRPVKDHVEAGSGFGPECKWRRQEPTTAANSREQPVDTSDVTSPPEAVPEGSSPPHTVSEDVIARMQAERDKLLHQYEVNRLQQEISTLRAALGTPRTDLTPPSQALGATVGDPNGPPPTSITPSHPITLPDVKHQPKIQTALRKLSTSVELLNNMLGHSTNGDAYNGDLETLDTDQWSPSSNFNEKDRDPNSVESRTGYLRERLALQTQRLRLLRRKHNETRVGIDHVRDWLENSHAAHAVDEVKSGSTDSGVRSPAISPMSQFGGSMPDVNNTDGHRQRQQSRVPARSQSFQLGQQRPSTHNITLRDQGTGEQLKYADPSIGVRSPTVSTTSPLSGSIPDVNSNAGQRHQSRNPARSQYFQSGQQRPSTYNIAPRDQGTGEQLKYADPSIGVRSPNVSTTSPLSGSIPDVNSNAGQRHQSRNPARSQYFQSGQQRPSAYNITPRDQGEHLQNAEPSIRVRRRAVSPTSPFGGSMHDVNSNDRQSHREHFQYAEPSLGVRRPAVSLTSLFGGSMHDVNSNDRQRHRLTRVEAFMRRRTLQNERVEYWNSKLIMNEKKRMQKTAVQNWLANHHTGQTPIDRRRHYSDTGGGQRGSPDVAMSNSSHFGGSMPNLHNYKGKHHHGSLWSHGTTDGLDAIGEGVEEPLPEDANDEHIESRNHKGQAAKPRDSFPSTSTHEDRVSHKKGDGGKSDRKIKTASASQDLATSDEASKRRSAQTHHSRKHQSVRSRDRDSKNPRGVEVRTTAEIVSHFFEDERIPQTDRRPEQEPKDKGVSGEEVALPSRKHPEKQDVRNKKPTQDNQNPRKPRSPSRGQRKPGDPSRSPRRKHSPSRSPRRRRSPSRGPEKPGNPSRRDRPVKGRRTAKNEPGRSRSMDVDRKRPNRGQRPSARDQSKLRSRGSTETSSGGKPGPVKKKEEQLIEGKQNPSGGQKRDQTSDGIGRKKNTSTGWASMMSLATTADDAGKSGSAKTRLQDDKRVNGKTYKADEDVVKAPDTNAMSGFFDGFMNLVGSDEQKEKNPTEPGVPGWGEDTGRSHGKASDDSSSLGFLGGLTQSISLPWDKDEKIQEDRNYPFMGSFAGGEDGDNQERGEPSVVKNLLRSFGGRHQKEEPGPGLIPAEMGSWKGGEDRGRAAADTNNQPVGFLRSLGQTFGVSPDESKQQETGSIFSNLLGSSEQRGGKHDETPAWTDDIKGLIFGTRQYEDVPEDDRTQADLNILKIFGKKEDSGDNEGRRKSSIDPAMMSQMSEGRGQNVEEESSFWNFLGLGGSDDIEPRGGDRRGDNPVRRGDNPVRDFFNDLF
ncbi:uncharacterized protein [Branchiostoma lanceolatum]|uniref:uncharacterized protein n=1 Tax=Branchiostoma lanceolatum TaxID=7740 RepID=UPI0034546249